jgi:hypothetical protein
VVRPAAVKVVSLASAMGFALRAVDPGPKRLFDFHPTRAARRAQGLNALFSAGSDKLP